MKKAGLLLFVMVLFTGISSYSQTPFRVNLTAGMTSPIGDFSNTYKGGVSVEALLFYYLHLIKMLETLVLRFPEFSL